MHCVEHFRTIECIVQRIFVPKILVQRIQVNLIVDSVFAYRLYSVYGNYG